MKFHPFAEVFPLLQGADFDELVADIKQHGLREPIQLYRGQVLDGRNRFLACQKANIKIRTTTFVGDDTAALAFVVSLNARRRHLTLEQRAMAAARIATLAKGSNQHGSRDPSSSGTLENKASDGLSAKKAAEKLDVSESSVKRAKKVVEKGSKSLQQAVESGDVPLKKAAAVVDLPKAEQLAAAKKAPDPKPVEAQSDDWMPDENEEARLAALEKEYTASIEKVMGADDKLAAAHAEIKRQAAEIATLRISRDGWQNRCGEQVRIIKGLRSKLAKMEKAAA